MASPVGLYLLAALVALSMSSLPVRASPSTSRRYYSCADFAGAKLQVKLEILHGNEEAIVTLSNEYLQTSLPDNPGDLKLLRAYKQLKRGRNLSDDIRALVEAISADYTEQTQTLVLACSGALPGNGPH